MNPIEKEIERVEQDISNLKRLKKNVKYGFLVVSIPLQIQHQKQLLKQLKNE